MVKVCVTATNMTTDEADIDIVLPMSEPELKSYLMDGCDYIVVEYDATVNFLTNDLFEMNKVLNRLNEENPSLDEYIISNIVNGDYELEDLYLDDDDTLDKLCNNDFMYEEIIVPHDTTLDCFEYLAYKLCCDYGIPFTLCESELDYAVEAGEAYPDWSIAWDNYSSLMGFRYRIGDATENFEESLILVNFEDAEDTD